MGIDNEIAEYLQNLHSKVLDDMKSLKVELLTLSAEIMKSGRLDSEEIHSIFLVIADLTTNEKLKNNIYNLVESDSIDGVYQIKFNELLKEFSINE